MIGAGGVIRSVVGLGLGLGLGGCAGRAAEPAPSPPVAVAVDAAPRDAAPLDQDLPALALRAVALYREISAAFDAAGTSCPTAIAALDDLRARHAEVLAANRAVLAAGRSAELAAALAPHDAALDDAARSLMHSTTMRSCAEDAAFARAFDALVAGASR